MKDKILEAVQISKTYGEGESAVHALRNSDLTLENGTFASIIGSSGSGKSTLLKILGGLLPPTTGKVLLDGQDIYAMNAEQLAQVRRQKIGFIFQGFNLLMQRNCLANVCFPMELSGLRGEKKWREQRALELLDIVGLKDKAKAYPAQLSGGQQQRVALARAIVIEPEVLLMDEPLSNLDAKLRVEMRNAIKRIQQQFGITTVYVTHDQEEALAVSDRIAVMDGGVIQQIDTPQRVYQRPANRFVSNFIGLSNFLNATVSRGEDGAELCFAGSDYRAAMTNLRGEASDGMDVLAAVRPEEFLLSTGEGEGIPATVRSSVFLGTTTHYFLTLPTGQEIEAVRDSDEEWAVIPDGAEVRLRVKPRRINVFTADGKRSLVIREELL